MPFLQWTRPRRHGAARSHVEHSSTDDTNTVSSVIISVSVRTPSGLHPAQLASFPVRPYPIERVPPPAPSPRCLPPADHSHGGATGKGKPGGLALASKECTVCLSDCNEGELVRALPCAHRFHVSCIDHWLAATTTCPMCRTDLRAAPLDHHLNHFKPSASLLCLPDKATT
ncbi:unnamed protein product [Closterium sp. Naga37s-1]|nr:unnamed protein product [Closterium sp. Naga37s-1]